MKKLLLVVAAATVLVACKKDNEPTPTPAVATKADILVAKNWRVSAQTATFTALGNTSTTDVYAGSAYPSCRRDNYAKFNANKTISFDEGATKCKATDPQTQSGTWEFNSDYTKLTIMDPTQGGTTLVFDVMELTGTTMRLRNTIVTNPSGITATSVNDLTLNSF